MAALRKGLPMLGRVLVAGQKPLSSPTPSLGQKMGFFSTSSDWKSWAFRKVGTVIGSSSIVRRAWALKGSFVDHLTIIIHVVAGR